MTDGNDRTEAAVEALRSIWPTLGHPDFWTESEADAALRRIVHAVLTASPSEICPDHGPFRADQFCRGCFPEG